jgi:Protein of unknown function (DUF1573)
VRALLAARLSLAAALLVLTSASARAEDAKAPRISVEPAAFDFGKTLPGKTLRKEFTLKNFGDAELVIENVSTTCGCTAALAPDTRLKPGAASPLRVTLETRSYSGRIERQVLVRSNDPKTPLLTVTISATVEAPVGK